MQDNKTYKKRHYNNGGKYNKNNYRALNNKSKADNEQKTDETNAYVVTYSSHDDSRSHYYFGLNIFDYYSREQLASLVRDPIGNNKMLREISRILYGTNGTYTNTVDYMDAMPTLDRVVVPYGKNNNKRNKNKSLMESTLRTIKDKEIVRDALWRGMIDGIAFYYLETTGIPVSMDRTLSDYEIGSIFEINEIGINASIFPLPADYTEIVGRKNNSYVIAFNLEYFCGNTIDAEKEILKFPKEIRDGYKKWVKNKEKFKNWLILDNTRTIVHKIRSEIREKYGRPLVLAAISDILYDDYFTDTKRHVLGEINNKVVYQTLPEGKDKGVCALTQKQQEKQHDTVKKAIMQKNGRNRTSFFTVSAGTKLDTLNVGDTDILDSKYESNLGDKIARALGFAGSALDGVGSGAYSAQQTNLELVTAQIFQWVDQISEELNKCINKHIIKDSKNRVECKYLPITYVNKGNMVGYAKDLYLQGKGSISLWVAATGIQPDVFFALLDQEVDMDWENKYQAHQTSYTLSDKKAGRPTTDNPTDNTIKSRNSNGNAVPTPSDKK